MSYDFKLNNELNQFDRLELDLCLDYSGGLQIVENKTKLFQDCNKILLTQKGTNMFHLDYGSDIKSYIGVADRDEILEPGIKNTTEEALLYYQELQTEQKQTQFVSLGERLVKIDYINVQWAGQNANEYFEKDNNLPANSAKLTYLDKIGITNGENTQITLNLKDQ